METSRIDLGFDRDSVFANEKNAREIAYILAQVSGLKDFFNDKRKNDIGKDYVYAFRYEGEHDFDALEKGNLILNLFKTFEGVKINKSSLGTKLFSNPRLAFTVFDNYLNSINWSMDKSYSGSNSLRAHTLLSSEAAENIEKALTEKVPDSTSYYVTIDQKDVAFEPKGSIKKGYVFDKFCNKTSINVSLATGTKMHEVRRILKTIEKNIPSFSVLTDSAEIVPLEKKLLNLDVFLYLTEQEASLSGTYRNSVLDHIYAESTNNQ